MVSEQKQPLNFFDNKKEINKKLSGKNVFIFLDYDGTLTPIVDTPDQAVLSEEMRSIVRRLAEAYTVSVVSGRATDDVRQKVGIDGIFYAGSHGFEIVTPDGQMKINDEARSIRPQVDRLHAKLTEKLKDVAGSLVEHVKYTISVHYRLVSEKDFSRIEKAVDEALQQNPDFRKTHGKKVFEIRPRIDWHKGKAVEWILKTLDFHPQEHVVIYIGDDTTDEDAFRAISGKGFGILVAAIPRRSFAEYMIKDTGEVKKVLEDLIKMRQQS